MVATDWRERQIQNVGSTLYRDQHGAFDGDHQNTTLL